LAADLDLELASLAIPVGAIALFTTKKVQPEKAMTKSINAQTSSRLSAIFAERQKLSSEIDSVQGSREALIIAELTSLTEEERGLCEEISSKQTGCAIATSLGTLSNPESIWLFGKPGQGCQLVWYDLNSFRNLDLPDNAVARKIQTALAAGATSKEILICLGY
jgi:hypothetical protein